MNDTNQELLAALLQLVLDAAAAYDKAGGTDITVASVTALLPNPTPLTLPDPAA